ncbi:MAG: ABC transporter ATP-binding protein [Acidimicrobiales bacterium]
MKERVQAGIHLDGVSRHFGKVGALDAVSFDVDAGEVLGLLGPNGAGKTTTMRIITGYLRPDRGRVRVGDFDVASDPVAARRIIGYLPESAAAPSELTVHAYLRSCARLRGLRRAERGPALDRAIERAGLTDVGGRRIGALSRGYRQRVSLAQALIHDPPVLVLDEPTAGLDPRQVAETRDLIAKLGRTRTILLSSHLLSEVTSLCKRVVIIDHGRVVAAQSVSALTAAAHGSRLVVQVTGDVERAAVVIAGVDGVISCLPAATGKLIVRGASDTLAEKVSAAVIAAGFGLVELRATTDTLEDAYLRTVGE